MLAFVFTFLMFGPFELFVSNMSYFVFSAKQLLPPIIIFGIAVLAVATVLFALLRGKIFNAVISLVLGITVAGYIQGNYINIDHGALDGTAVAWHDFKWQMLGNLLIWAVIILIPIIFCYFRRDVWKSFVRIVSLVLVVMQVFGTVYLVVKSAYQIKNDVSGDGYFECSEQFKVSKNKNTIVFLLDRMDKKYMDKLLAKDPELREKLSGFTYYKNFTGSYSRTFPSVTYLLSGKNIIMICRRESIWRRQCASQPSFPPLPLRVTKQDFIQTLSTWRETLKTSEVPSKTPQHRREKQSR